MAMILLGIFRFLSFNEQDRGEEKRTRGEEECNRQTRERATREVRKRRASERQARQMRHRVNIVCHHSNLPLSHSKAAAEATRPGLVNFQKLNKAL